MSSTSYLNWLHQEIEKDLIQKHWNSIAPVKQTQMTHPPKKHEPTLREIKEKLHAI